MEGLRERERERERERMNYDNHFSLLAMSSRDTLTPLTNQLPGGLPGRHTVTI